jgi:hypothetical protein
MAVRADSQQDNVEPGTKSVEGPSDRPERPGVSRRGLRGRPQLSSHSMDARAGDRNSREERVPGRTEVAVRMMGRDAALVGEKHLRSGPGKATSVGAGEASVEFERRPSPRDYEGEPTVLSHRPRRGDEEMARQRPARCMQVPEDPRSTRYT